MGIDEQLPRPVPTGKSFAMIRTAGPLCGKTCPHYQPQATCTLSKQPRRLAVVYPYHGWTDKAAIERSKFCRDIVEDEERYRGFANPNLIEIPWPPERLALSAVV